MAETPGGDAAPGSPSDMDDEMLRRSRMTRKFTQLREQMADESLQPAGPGAAPAVAGGRDSSPQLDAWLRGHLNATGPMEPADEAGNDDGEGEGEENAYGSDEFEEYHDDEESDAEHQEDQGPEQRQRLTLEGAAALLRAAARGEVAHWQAGALGGDGPGDAAPVSPDRDPAPMIPVSQSSPSSSLSSPDHPGGGADPIAPLLAMLAQIRAIRGQTLAAVERLAPHMPEVVDIVAGLEEEAAELQAAFDQLLQPLPRGEIRQPNRQDLQDQRTLGVVAQLLQPSIDGLDDQQGGQDELDYLQAPCEPSVSIDILPSGFRVTERPVDVATSNKPAVRTAAAAAAPAPAAPSSAASIAATLLPGGGQGLLIGGLDIVRDETLRAQCSHVISICTKHEFDLDAHVNPHGFSIPAFGFSFEHVVLELADSPLAGPLVESGRLTSLLQPAFDALDAWVASSREWTVGGRSKRLMMHSVHGRSRPAAVLCAWMMSKGAGKVTLADALRAIQAHFGQPHAQTNFGFVAQLLEYEQSFAAAQPTLRLAGPSVCIWEYVGLTEAEWHAELGRKHPGVLDRTSARRILAAARRRQRQTDDLEPEPETEAETAEPLNPRRPSIHIDLDPAAHSGAAMLSALGAGERARASARAVPLSTDLPIDAPPDMGTDTTATNADLDVAWSRQELDAALCGRNNRGEIDWTQFAEVD